MVRDRRWMLVQDSGGTTGWDIWAFGVDGSETKAVAASEWTERLGHFSPDGQWIAYESNESGRAEVYVVSFPGLGGKRQVSTGGGIAPIWDPSGKSLYYLQNGYLVAHDVRLGATLGTGGATRLFPTTATEFDVMPGKRFVLTEPNTAAPDSPLHVIFNWFEELKAKVPPAR